MAPTPKNASASPLAQYQQHLEAGNLAFQVDCQTGQPVFYPRVSAPTTGNSLAWKISSGLGTVYATTVVHQREGSTYNVALIDMDEGFRLMSRVESIPAEEVSIGLRVKAKIHPAQGDTPPYPTFVPLERE